MQISDQIAKEGPRPRLIWLLIVGLAVVVLVIATIAGQEQRARYQAEMDVRLRTLALQRANVLARTLENWRAQLRFLTLTPSVAGLTRAAADRLDAQAGAADATLRNRLESLFNGYVQAQPNVVRVSYWSIAERRPLVAVDDDDQAEPADLLPAELAEVDRFTGTTGESLHISNLEPQREHAGSQSRPLLRLSAPVAGPDGAPFGVLVVTIDARSLLSDLTADLNPIFRLYLLDGQGNFLLHPDPARSFAMVGNQPWRWQNEFPSASEQDDRSQTRLYEATNGSVRAARQQVAMGRDPEKHLVVAVSVADRLIADSADNVRLWVAGVGLSLTGLVAGLLLLGHQARRRDHAIRARDAWLGALVRSARDAIIGLDLDGCVTSWNDAAAHLFALTTAEVLGRPLQELIVPAGLEAQTLDMVTRVSGGESVVNQQTRCQSANGRMLDVAVTATPVSAGERVVGVALIIRDVSEQLLAEAGLRAMAARLEQQVRERTKEIEALAAQRHAVMEGTGAAIIACDQTGIITLFNPAAALMLGYSPADVVGKATPALFLDPAELATRANATMPDGGEPASAVVDILTANATSSRADIRAWAGIRQDGRRLPLLMATTLATEGNMSAACLIVAIPLPA